MRHKIQKIHIDNVIKDILDKRYVHSSIYENDGDYVASQWIFCSILNKPVDGECLRQMYRHGIISDFIPEFQDIDKLKQKKQHGKNLLEHIISVYCSVDPVLAYFKKRGFDPWDEEEDNVLLVSRKDAKTMLLFSAFLHDIGKVIDVASHPRHSYLISRDFLHNCELFLNIQDFATIVERMILLHMRPLGYQRDEPWSDKAIEKFIRDAADYNVAILIVILSAMDKYGSTRNFFYLDKLIELCNRIRDIA